MMRRHYLGPVQAYDLSLCVESNTAVNIQSDYNIKPQINNNVFTFIKPCIVFAVLQ